MPSILAELDQSKNLPQIPKDYLLEPKFYAPYEEWKQKNDPVAADRLIKSLQPVIRRASKAFGGADAPLIRGHAKRIILDELPKYDPRAGKLESFLMSRLQRLRRLSAQSRQMIKVPERVAMDRIAIDAAEKELEDTLHRAPSLGELADYTGLSKARIEKVKTYQMGVSEGQIAESDPEQIGGFMPAVAQKKRSIYMDFLYDELPPTDQFLMDHVLGRKGGRKMRPGEAARKLNISPSAVSQRLRRIESRLRQLAESELF